ncbi:MAG: phosphatidate cytidylyltransferase [Nitrospinae bacterium]|nr:phosphatidate cytidylyltransferase [Nitrospinota bacterium]
MALRIISGVALAAVALAVLLSGTPLMFFVFMGVFAALGLWEFFAMMKAGGEPSLPAAGIVFGLGLYAAMFFLGPEGFFMLASLALIAIFGAAPFSGATDAYRAAANTVFGIFYISLTFGSAALIRTLPDGAMITVMLALANVLCDSLAYFTGRAIGKTPLAPSISPKKTVEGFIGGFIGAVAGAVIIKILFLPALALGHAAIAGVIVGIVGPAGDLAESALKRKMMVKDSGSIIPGHGGALDRMDSVMFNAAALYVYFKAVALA